MTTHRTLPSEVEPDRLADLIADCAQLPRRFIDLTVQRPLRRVLQLPDQREPIAIPDTTKSMVDGMGDYGT
ncbi:MAG: hypothetical protein QOG53_3389 [Frankiales bacterium]|nr:hypothetical protein [Frankiales bacterium]